VNILEVRNLTVWFPRKSSLLRRTIGHVKAVTDVSFVIPTGKTVGLVGESGSGKTTVGMAMMNLVSATEGNILFRHVRIRERARTMDMVFAVQGCTKRGFDRSVECAVDRGSAGD
jgi:ABC-type oligopeptide transport system ATPase subunit